MVGRADLMIALVGIALGSGALLLLPSQIRDQSYTAIGDIQSPAFFPILISLLLLIVSATLAVSAIRGRTTPAETQIDDHDREGDAGPVEAPRRLIGAALCLAGYYVALDLVGMVPASIAVIALLSLVLGFRRYAMLTGIAIALPASVYFLFEKALFVLLPGGRLF